MDRPIRLTERLPYLLTGLAMLIVVASRVTTLVTQGHLDRAECIALGGASVLLTISVVQWVRLGRPAPSRSGPERPR